MFLTGESIIDNLKKSKGSLTLILFNISYDARDHDIKSHFHGVKIASIETLSRGTFSVVFNDIEEAIKFVNFKETVKILFFLSGFSYYFSRF